MCIYIWGGVPPGGNMFARQATKGARSRWVAASIICIYICIYMYIRTCIHTCIDRYMYVCLCIYLYLYIYTSMYIYMQYVWGGNMFARQSTKGARSSLVPPSDVYIYICIHMDMSVYVCMCISIYKYI